MDGLQGPVIFLVVHDTQVFVPLDHLGCIHDQRFYQVGVVGVVPAPHDVQVVNAGSVVGLGGRLDSSLSHHGVGVTEAKLGDQQHVCAPVLGHERRGGAGSAAAHHQHVHLVVHLAEVHIRRIHPGMRLKDIGELVRHLVSRVGSELERPECLGFVIGMVLVQNGL